MYRRDAHFSIVPLALVVAVLLVPFVMNFLAHAWYGEKRFSPLTMMKLPADDSAITLPEKIRQFEPFEVSLQLETIELAKRINDMAVESVPGTELQHIHSTVFPEMQAEISGDAFSANLSGPQTQLFSSHGQTRWSWVMTPEAEGHQQLSLKLHLQTADATQEHPQIADLAEIQIFVHENQGGWLRTYGIWCGVAILLAAGWWWRSRRVRKQE